MITDKRAFKCSKLRRFWESNGQDSSGLPPDQTSRIKMLLIHLDSARSLEDIAEGLGKIREFHKLKGVKKRYALSVNGNYRVTFGCADSCTGIVDQIDFEDYH